MNAGPLLIHNLSWLSLFQNYPSDNREETGSTGIYGQCGSHCANVKHYMSHLQLLSVDSEQQVAEQSELSKPPKHICTDNVGLRPHRLCATWADVLGGGYFWKTEREGLREGLSICSKLPNSLLWRRNARRVNIQGAQGFKINTAHTSAEQTERGGISIRFSILFSMFVYLVYQRFDTGPCRVRNQAASSGSWVGHMRKPSGTAAASRPPRPASPIRLYPT